MEALNNSLLVGGRRAGGAAPPRVRLPTAGKEEEE
jgi:hypothetical protein